jgi:two-component system response regulator (stage 0 sporulation protein F)
MVGVLVVDDMPETRQVLCNVLEREGFETFEAEDGRAAVAAVRHYRDQISIALIDIDLSGQEGKDVAERLRRELPTLRVVFMTGHDRGELIEANRLDAHERFLAKPFRISDILSSVTREAAAVLPRPATTH